MTVRAAGVSLAVVLAMPASAAPPKTLELEATVQDVEIGTVGQDPVLVAVGPDRTWVIAPDLSEVQASWVGGGHAVVVSPRGAIYTCGPKGVSRTEFTSEGPRTTPLGETVCRDIAMLAPKDGVERLVVAGQALEVWSLPSGERPEIRRLEGELDGWPILAVAGKRFAAVTEGGEAVLEEGPWGTSALATGGPVGGLAMGPSSWVWSLPKEDVLVDVTRRRLPVGSGPGALAAGDLDGDELDDLIIAYPDRPVLGLVPGGTREVMEATAPVGVRRVVLGDLDVDGCEAGILATASGSLMRLDRPCSADAELAAIPEEGIERSQPEARTPLLVGGAQAEVVRLDVGQRLDRRLQDVGGRATAYAASGGPTGLVVTSSGTVLYRAKAEDVGTWRVQVRLWEDGSWARRSSFEIIVRNEGTPSTGPRVSSTTGDLTEALGEDVGHLERNLPIRSCLFGLGGVIGGSRGRSWVTLGEGFLVSGSPAVSVGCEGQARRGLALHWYAGVDLAPFFTYLVDGDTFRHGIAVTAGAGYAREHVYAGGYVTAGATLLGMGPMVRWMPLEGPSGRRSGFEARLTWMPSQQVIVEGMVLYTIQAGPRPPKLRTESP